MYMCMHMYTCMYMETKLKPACVTLFSVDQPLHAHSVRILSHMSGLFLVPLFAGAFASAPLNHIFFLLADDWGSYDAGFRIRDLGRTPDVLTPTIDALASTGLTFDNYYVQPICTPTRASLLTGRYSIHTGSEHILFGVNEPSCLPTTLPLMPVAFKRLGYQTHGIGKVRPPTPVI